MLPFVAIDESKIAPFHPFGICCALAFFFWDWALMKLAIRRGFERADVRVLTVELGVLGWGFAWGIDALFYRSATTAPGTGVGLSSTGAIVGATVAAILWCRVAIARVQGRWTIRRRERPHSVLLLSEVILATYPMAWAIGRLGCALVHDHIGKAVTPGTLGSLFAVGFPRSAEDGVHRALGPLHLVTGGSDLRFDLGLLEFLFLLVLGGAFMLSWRRTEQLRIGTYTTIGSLVYGPFRFLLDFLRVEEGATGDTRHAGLTFAQYWSLAVIALGVALLVRRKRQAASQSTVIEPDTPPA